MESSSNLADGRRSNKWLNGGDEETLKRMLNADVEMALQLVSLVIIIGCAKRSVMHTYIMNMHANIPVCIHISLCVCV